MWKKIKNTSYYLDVTIDSKYEVVITDFVKVWSCSLSKEMLIQCLMNCEDNDGLEIDTEELLDKGTKILLSPEKLSSSYFYEYDLPYGDKPELIVSLAMDFGFELSIRLELDQGSHEMFFQKVTQPLLNVVSDLKESEAELRKLVTIKDEEITEYKTQGGKIKYTALRPYNDAEHMSKHQCYKNFFESTSDPQNVLKKIIEEGPHKPLRKEKKIKKTKRVSLKEESSGASQSQTNNVIITAKKRSTDNDITIKEESSSETPLVQPNTGEFTNTSPVKVEPPSQNIDSEQETNATEVQVKNEFKRFMPKKKRLNL